MIDDVDVDGDGDGDGDGMGCAVGLMDGDGGVSNLVPLYCKGKIYFQLDPSTGDGYFHQFHAASANCVQSPNTRHIYSFCFSLEQCPSNTYHTVVYPAIECHMVCSQLQIVSLFFYGLYIVVVVLTVTADSEEAGSVAVAVAAVVAYIVEAYHLMSRQRNPLVVVALAVVWYQKAVAEVLESDMMLWMHRQRSACLRAGEQPSRE